MTLNALEVGECLIKVMSMIDNESHAQGVVMGVGSTADEWINQGRLIGRSEGYDIGYDTGLKEGIKSSIIFNSEDVEEYETEPDDEIIKKFGKVINFNSKGEIISCL